MDKTKIFWSDYMRYRLRLRGFDLATVERWCDTQVKDTGTPSPADSSLSVATMNV